MIVRGEEAAIGARLYDAPGRLQMDDLRHYFALHQVVVDRLTGESHQDVVHATDVVICAPFDQLNIAHSGGELPHALENVGGKAFHAGQHGMQSAASHARQLRAREVRADLVVYADIGVGCGQPAKQLFGVFRRHDVINGKEVVPGMFPRESVQLVNHIVNTLGAELHAGTVQTAEGAVVLFSPPAAAGGLNGNH